MSLVVAQKLTQETFLFLRRWVQNPKNVGSIIPSSRYLSRTIAELTLKGLQKEDYVVELGPGTGVFTEALLAAGLHPSKLICIELDHKFATYLKQRYPDILIIQGSASEIDSLLPQKIKGSVGCILSGLPLLNFPQHFHKKLTQACLNVLSPSGSVVQFSYGWGSPLKTHEQLKKHKEKRIWLNIPPATIWRYKITKHIE